MKHIWILIAGTALTTLALNHLPTALDANVFAGPAVDQTAEIIPPILPIPGKTSMPDQTAEILPPILPIPGGTGGTGGQV